MALRNGSGANKSPPAGPPPSLQKSSSGSQSARNQKSILGFFQKKSSTDLPTRTANGSINPAPGPTGGRIFVKKPATKRGSSQSLTPAPSSDAPSSPQHSPTTNGDRVDHNGLPSPITPVNEEVVRVKNADVNGAAAASSSPSRKARKAINYAESGGEDDDDEPAFEPVRSTASRARASKRRRTSLEDESEDDFVADEGDAGADVDDDIDDFIVPDDSDEDVSSSKKRKRLSKAPSRKSSAPLPPPPMQESDDDVEMPTASTALQWTYNPDDVQPFQPRAKLRAAKPNTAERKYKEKAHTTEPEQRYPWLATITDADRNPPGHPDYDPRTVYIPPLAWAKFSPFEKQYWEIKQKYWDTIVFFKKGKFYELYENDATIGHQMFDLKLTDRVNMRMVGVPEMSLAHWANQFVAKGFKIARVDQCESALGKEMRERDGQTAAKPAKEDKVIRRELAQVLTAGTLVDGGMLQDDMSTYCVSIKEGVIDGLPGFGICFVDTATAQFSITQFVDDVDLTKFETFVAQTRPQELLLEKSCISVKALRILKNNTGPTTIWNYLKPGKEFWTADITCREIDASGYFVSQDRDNAEAWPKSIQESRDKELLMSALGALVQYLRTLKIERELMTLGNFTWYDPIRKASSLVLDGQTLINLEVFANTFDGGAAGTLFALLNRCITPFGKRTFRQWVCHPLVDAVKINARLDAVESLNADTTIRDRFTSQLTKLPDLERLISRIHAGSCRAQDFLKVLEGFEQIEYTMSLLSAVGGGDGVIGQLITAMPDLDSALKHWKTAFDRTKARQDDILVPERGVEGDFDEGQDRIDSILADLETLLKKYRRDLGSTAIVYRDNGKEIYQLEVPAKVKSVPKNWSQMSATQKVKRYYTPDLKALVRQLQEAQETHGQIVKEVAGRFFARFDEQYATWLGAVKIVAQLDCLISLAKASSVLGEPSCRPEFAEQERSVVEFEDLRHPCMLQSVSDFIPNDVMLGGEAANISLLTGANAAGKSTILRMTCIAVIMAQIGCYVPCKQARLTPVDRIMSRLGANDNIFAAQSTFFVELSETKKILAEATPRSMVILDELGRGTSSYDGVAVAQAVLHHVATHIGCTGFFATHYHSLATEFADHPEITPRRMRIHVDEQDRRVTFLYKLEEGVAEGSFGMHCAAMCGIPGKVIDRAEEAAREWEHTSRLKESLEKAKSGCYIPLGIQSDVSWVLRGELGEVDDRSLNVLLKAIEGM
ncbi:MAG: DNA mismatch repair protein msh6 [Thelocarpon impressellum]|nr:MAG: DNA mismatch repair protein msh6 [Thelocarpon impressellum]